MNRLEEQFGDEVYFFHLNVDLAETLPIRQQYGLNRQSQYQMLGKDGLPIAYWFGPLNEEIMVRQFVANLANK